MDEVPLTDAIKNLARQASLNYMLDPKINYGTPDANGVVHPQPNVSLRWENLTADQALNAVLNNYNLIIVDDPKTHIALITVKDPAAPEPLLTKIIQLKYSSASNMVAASFAILVDKRSKVIPDTRTSQIVVVATEREIVAMDELVARLDTPTKEVLIEARIVETEKNPTTAKGIDWSGTLQAQNIRFGNNVTGGAVRWPAFHPNHHGGHEHCRRLRQDHNWWRHPEQHHSESRTARGYRQGSGSDNRILERRWLERRAVLPEYGCRCADSLHPARRDAGQ